MCKIVVRRRPDAEGTWLNRRGSGRLALAMGSVKNIGRRTGGV